MTRSRVSFAGRRRLSGLVLGALLLSPAVAVAQVPTPVPFAFGHPPKLMPIPHAVGHPLAARHALQSNAVVRSPNATAGTWTPLVNEPDFFNGASNPILLTDGTVLIQDTGFNDWYRLTPDRNGSYVDGTWTEIANAPYDPLWHSTAVLPDGRMIIEGGEYLCTPAACNPVWTNLGAIYDPTTNVWTSIAPPAGWTTIGDAQSVVLPDGTYMQANCCTFQSALLNPLTLTWTPTGSGKFDPNDEEGWNLLPNGKVLAVDAYVPLGGFPYMPTGTNSELYNPATGLWSSAGSTVVQLWDSAATCGGEDVASFELGPGVLRPDGTVFYTGANSCGAGRTAIYNSYSGKWRAGPPFPDGDDIADGPAALEPNGDVLMMASPGIFKAPSTFYEWNGRALTAIPGPPNAPFDPSFVGTMLVLPTGQILLTDTSNDIEIYTPTGHPSPNWAPVVMFVPHVLAPGQSYKLAGARLGGMSQGAFYGDDDQSSTNFPLVRITNVATGHVFYCRTHDFSSDAVASNLVSFTDFDVPADQEPGPSELQVVADGIASKPVMVTISKGTRD